MRDCGLNLWINLEDGNGNKIGHIPSRGKHRFNIFYWARIIALIIPARTHIFIYLNVLPVSYYII